MRLIAALAFVTACRFAFDDHPNADANADGTAIDAKPACPADALLCDDFELGNLSRWTATRGSAAADGAQPRAGAFSLDSSVPPQSGNGGEAFAYLTLATQYDLLATRAWFYFPDPIEAFQGVIYLVDLPAESHYLEVVTDLGGWTVAGNGGTLMDYSSTVQVTAQHWTCVELDVDRIAGRFEVFIDDAVAIDTAVDDASPAFNTLAIGATRANSDGYHVFADDAVVATSHIGCD